MNAQLDYYNFTEDSSTPFPSTGTSATMLYQGTGDDEETPNIPIGFDFFYNGKIYNTCTIGVNGAISFSEDQIYAGNDLASTSTGHFNIIAPFWDDLILYSSNYPWIKYETTGTAPNRVFTVHWHNLSKYGDDSNWFSFLVQLHETTNNIDFYYGYKTGGTSDASIGINAFDGTNTSFLSVTPGTPATVSSNTANNNISIGDIDTSNNNSLHYTFSFNHAYNDFNYNASLLSMTAPRDATHPVYYVNNMGASNSGGSNLPTCNDFQGGDVWFKFVAPSTGAINLIRLDHGGIGSLGFAVYHNDFNSPVVYCDYLSEAANTLGTRNLIKDLTPGDTYYLRMWDYGNNDFGITKFYAETIEPNDEAANAKDIGVQPENASLFLLTNANNTYTTGSEDINGTPSCGGYQGGDVWYKFTATSSGEIKIVHTDTAGDWSSLAFAIYDSPSANTAIYCDYIYLSGTPPFNKQVITGSTAGNIYYLRIWDWDDDNIGNSGQFYLTDNVVGVEEYKSLKFEYYPNPATNVLNINAQVKIDSITLTNLLGQEVLKAQPSHTQTSLNISSLKQGVYLMKVKIGDKVSTVKIVKK
jgi:hypothetical protein